MEILIIGLGRFGYSVAMNLVENGVRVTVVDTDETKVKAVLENVDQGFVLNSMDEKALEEIGAEHFDSVIIGLGKSSMKASLLTALNLEEMGAKNIIAKASSAAHHKLLEKIGIKKIIQPEADMGRKVAFKITKKCIVDYIELSEDVQIDNVLVDQNLKKFYEKTIQDINLRKKFQVNIIAIQRDADIIIPEKDTLIKENDVLIIIGKKEKITKFETSYKI